MNSSNQSQDTDGGMPNEVFEAKVKHEDTRHVDWASGIAGMKHVKKCRPICVQFLVTINVHNQTRVLISVCRKVTG